MTHRRIVHVLAAAMLAVACDDDGNGPGDGTSTGYELVNAYPNLAFARPADIQHAGDGTNRVFVVEQGGRILVFPDDPAAADAAVFLDITDRVQAPVNSEMGLLGLAFHPAYESNGYFFVQYTAGTSSNRRGRVSRFQVSGADADAADPASETILLDFADGAPNHNGGALCFGADGYLYIALGDEGGAGDSFDNAQDRSTLFGSILRIDVDQDAAPPYYGIPPDNPYAGNANGWREEIWAYGLRNPWRISYDAAADLLVAGDVGQRSWEEINFIAKGGNYGWDCREGLVAYSGNEHPPSPLCATATGFIDPVHVYGRSEGQSVTGGYVYRGSAVPSLAGKYVYGDYISGRIWALNVGSLANVLVRDTSLFISTFGVVQGGELRVAGYFADDTPTSLYRIVEAGVQP